jgi:hypothetical protein
MEAIDGTAPHPATCPREGIGASIKVKYLID